MNTTEEVIHDFRFVESEGGECTHPITMDFDKFLSIDVLDEIEPLNRLANTHMHSSESAASYESSEYDADIKSMLSQESQDGFDELALLDSSMGKEEASLTEVYAYQTQAHATARCFRSATSGRAYANYVQARNRALLRKQRAYTNYVQARSRARERAILRKEQAYANYTQARNRALARFRKSRTATGIPEPENQMDREKPLSSHKINPSLEYAESAEEKPVQSPESPPAATEKKNNTKWKKSKPWTHIEEVFLIGAVFERLFSRGSLGKADGASKSNKNECWENLKGSYDSSLQTYLARIRKRCSYQPRTVMALTRHFKVMKARVAANLERSSSDTPDLSNSIFRKLFREYEDILMSNEEELLKHAAARSRTVSCDDVQTRKRKRRKHSSTVC